MPMPTVEPFPAGGYRFISHQFQYSGGIAAEPGFRIEHARAELLGFDASFERRVDALAEQDFQVDAAGGGGAVGEVGVAVGSLVDPLPVPGLIAPWALPFRSRKSALRRATRGFTGRAAM